LIGKHHAQAKLSCYWLDLGVVVLYGFSSNDVRVLGVTVSSDLTIDKQNGKLLNGSRYYRALETGKRQHSVSFI